MNLTAFISKRLIKRKFATIVLVSASLAAFATLGDGGKKGKNKDLNTTPFNSKNFSLRSGYNYKSNQLFNSTQKQFIILNTVATYQKGNATYVLPLKKKILLEKIKFSPSR
ncbi:MAG TPA: hypothetical protein VFQ73_16245 [Flavisolibacter sp.]|nr:hypothetical protein [Flavisolibacter sp.]